METLVVAGRCTTRYRTADSDRQQHGDVVVVCKPDDTLLVHDADGYQPVAWLTRPEAVLVEADRILARDGDDRLVVEIEDCYSRGRYPAGPAGTPVGDCPDCGATLIRSRGTVTCSDCEASYGLPTDSTVLDACCDECGLPQIRVERGEELTVCLDRGCEPIAAQVQNIFDEAWDCPDCGSPLRVLNRGGLVLGCDAYPDCETSFRFPTGVVDGRCGCGLPAFETPSGRRCLDGTCNRVEAFCSD